MRHVVLAAMFVSAACGSGPPPLADTYPSPDALARQVLLALDNGDRARLQMLALSENEFRIHVWPHLPAARPERNLPFAYVWGDLQQKSTTSLEDLWSRYRGRRFDLINVTFAGEITSYGPFQVHRKAVFNVRDGVSLVTLRACGSLIVKDGRWKVFSYVTDE